MLDARPARTLALAAMILPLALVAAGCAHRAQSPDTGAVVSPAAVDAPATTPAAAPAAASPGSTPGTPDASALPTPDLSAVDGLIQSIQADLRAESSAAADEGSTP